MKTKKITFGDLKVAIERLTPEQLDMPALWLGDERGGAIGGIDVLSEEHVNYGEGLEPWSSYEGGEYAKEDALAIYPQGTVFLLSDVGLSE